MKLNDDWLNIIKQNKYVNSKFNHILKLILDMYDKKNIYPSKENIFKAFNLTSFNNVKVVIIGQDPYHGEGEANGLAFSLNEDVKITPSLRNIFRELNSDLNINKTNKDLSGWAKQGVLLINSVLTVEKDKPMSHKNLGWQEITDYLIKYISDNKDNTVFILWGKESEEKLKYIDQNKHLVIISSHPSPLSARKSFFGSKPFTKTNNYLKKNNQSVIDWSL